VVRQLAKESREMPHHFAAVTEIARLEVARVLPPGDRDHSEDHGQRRGPAAAGDQRGERVGAECREQPQKEIRRQQEHGDVVHAVERAE
jgi:hypothetical protein